MSETRRRFIWALEIIFIVLFVIAGTAPILDYTKRESLAYIKEPTEQNLNALRAKKNEEVRAHLMYAFPFGLAAALLAIPLLSKKKA